MGFKTFDYHCDNCDHDEIDLLIEEGEEPDCPKCSTKLTKIFPVPHFAFGAGFFRGMAPRNIEVEYHNHDGSVVRQNLTNKINLTDTSQPGD